MSRAITAALLTGAALLAGCGGGETYSPSARSIQEPAQTAQAAPGDVRVAMKDYEFIPQDVTVQEGETITWVNEDTVQHNAVAAEGEGPSSELFNEGESYSWTAESAGVIPYVCTIHPGMEGTITVR